MLLALCSSGLGNASTGSRLRAWLGSVGFGLRRCARTGSGLLCYGFGFGLGSLGARGSWRWDVWFARFVAVDLRISNGSLGLNRTEIHSRAECPVVPRVSAIVVLAGESNEVDVQVWLKWVLVKSDGRLGGVIGVALKEGEKRARYSRIEKARRRLWRFVYTLGMR